MSEYTQTLGARFKACRVLVGWSLRDLAGALDISPATLLRIEKGDGVCSYEHGRAVEDWCDGVEGRKPKACRAHKFVCVRCGESP